MFLMLRKITTFILAFSLVLIFITGCSCSTDSNSSPNPPVSDTPESTGNGMNDPEPLPEGSSDVTKEDEPIIFEDPLFFELLKKSLNKEMITPKDLDPYTGLTLLADEFIILAGEGIEEKSLVYFNEDAFEYDGIRYTGFGTLKSLADLKHFKNLTKLNITLQPDLNYDTIPDNVLSTVNFLYIYQSQLEDLSFLKEASALRLLNLGTNSVSDLSPLEGKESLTWLFLNWNKVEDLTALSSMTNLKSLSAYGNKISDLTPLAMLQHLESIELYQNLITDISPLKEIKTLKTVELINNQIEDVSPLQDFEAFDELRLSGNPIKNLDVLSHITTLEYDPQY